MTLEELEKLHAKGFVNACPECGKEYLAQCYHGQEVYPKEMPVGKALELIGNSIKECGDELEALGAQAEEYAKIIEAVTQ